MNIPVFSEVLIHYHLTQRLISHLYPTPNTVKAFPGTRHKFIKNLAIAGTKIFTGILAEEANTNCNMLPYSKNWHLSNHTSPSLESLASLRFRCSEGPRSKTSGHQYSYWSPHQEWCGPKRLPLQTNFALSHTTSWSQWSEHRHTKPFGFNWNVQTTNSR